MPVPSHRPGIKDTPLPPLREGVLPFRPHMLQKARTEDDVQVLPGWLLPGWSATVQGRRAPQVDDEPGTADGQDGKGGPAVGHRRRRRERRRRRGPAWGSQGLFPRQERWWRRRRRRKEELEGQETTPVEVILASSL